MEEEGSEPDYVIYNAGSFPANRLTAGMTSSTSIDLSFESREMVILGTEYAGEMKKGVFTIMNYGYRRWIFRGRQMLETAAPQSCSGYRGSDNRVYEITRYGVGSGERRMRGMTRIYGIMGVFVMRRSLSGREKLGGRIWTGYI